MTWTTPSRWLAVAMLLAPCLAGLPSLAADPDQPAAPNEAVSPALAPIRMPVSNATSWRSLPDHRAPSVGAAPLRARTLPGNRAAEALWRRSLDPARWLARYGSVEVRRHTRSK